MWTTRGVTVYNDAFLTVKLLPGDKGDLLSMTRIFEFSVAMGAAFDIPVGAGDLVVDVRYDLGLTSIDDTAAGEDVKNWALGIMVGYGRTR